MSVKTALRIGRGSVISFIVGFGGMVWASEPMLPIPENLDRWPVMALMALITLSSLGLAALSLIKAYSGIGQLAELLTLQKETNVRLNEIGAKMTEANSKPCALSRADFREFMRETMKEIKP